LILITGGAGFIGANFVRDWCAHSDVPVVNLDKLTYAGNLGNLDDLKGNPRHVFVHGDIGDRTLVRGLLQQHRPTAIVHFAAESHVDRSITGPAVFVEVNAVGTFNLLTEALAYWQALAPAEQSAFRFHHISTDEVYGSLGSDDPAFSETTPYQPNSPYAASKAASDHFVRAFHHTYGLPTLTTNCSNNYGPLQFPEKFVPLMILNALEGKPLPVYGDGLNVRDWLYVGDHCDAVRLVLARGRPGETYNIGGNSEKRNIDVLQTLCAILDRVHPSGAPHAKLVTYVKDRPGHDRRYAIDATKLRRELDWQPRTSFEQGMERTVQWYLDHMDWVRSVTSGAYRDWMKQNYADRDKS
jgi:dTDP-glucose 4,6-dehydratase